MKVKSESEVTQSCPTLSDLMDCSLPGSSIHGIFQARVLEWVAIAFSDITLYIHVIFHIHIKHYIYMYIFVVTQMVKNLPTMQETQVQSLSWEDPLEKGISINSSILAWEIPWIEEPGRLQSMRS